MDRICNDGTWVPNLYQFFFRVLPRLQQRLKNPFRLQADMTTAQGESPAHVAVREALANAVVHADYMGVGGVCIRQYPDKLLLENPGTLLLTKETMLRGGMSRCRNMALQSMFMMMGIADRAGSGIDKIMLGWADQCLLPPTVEEQRTPARVVWEMPFAGILPKEGEQMLREHFGAERFEPLSSLQRVLLMIVAGSTAISHREIKALLPAVHGADLTRELSFLSSGGFLVCMGRTKAAKYTIADNMRGEKWGGQHGAESKVLPDETDSLDAGRGVEWLGGQELESSLEEEIAAFREAKHSSSSLLDDLVMQICQGRWISIPQLAIMLNRSPEYLRRRCVQPLLRHGLLVKRHQDDTHPQQAYSVAARK